MLVILAQMERRCCVILLAVIRGCLGQPTFREAELFGGQRVEGNVGMFRSVDGWRGWRRVLVSAARKSRTHQWSPGSSHNAETLKVTKGFWPGSWGVQPSPGDILGSPVNAGQPAGTASLSGHSSYHHQSESGNNDTLDWRKLRLFFFFL